MLESSLLLIKEQVQHYLNEQSQGNVPLYFEQLSTIAHDVEREYGVEFYYETPQDRMTPQQTIPRMSVNEEAETHSLNKE